MVRQVQNTTKYLGVYIDEILSWNFHVDYVCKKANNARSFLQKKCPSSVRARCYLTLVRSIPEYVCVVWSPYTLNNIQKIERVQRKGARFVCNNFSMYSSVTAMLNKLNSTSFKDRRDTSRLAMMYRIVDNLVDSSSSLIINVPLCMGSSKAPQVLQITCNTLCQPQPVQYTTLTPQIKRNHRVIYHI